MRLKDKVVLITGATSKLGRPISQLLAQEGARLALCFHQSRDQASQLSKELNSSECHTEIFQFDFSVPTDHSRLIESVTAHFGRLDALVNNASVFYPTPMDKITEETWNAILATNVSGPSLLIQSAAPWLKKQRGAVVNITDIHAEEPGLRNHIPYCVSKSALNAATKAYAQALAPEVRVNAVAPGTITFPENYSEEEKKALREKVPLGREGKPEDIAEAVAFLLTTSEYITGIVLAVDGGRST